MASQKRNIVDMMKQKGVSERRSCQLARISRNGYRYKSIKKDDSLLIETLKSYSQKHPREGYRKAGAFATHELEEPINHKRVQRIWKDENLTVPKKTKRRRRGKGVATPPYAGFPNHIWAVDFMHDSTIKGIPLRLLTVTDEFTRESLCISVNKSFKSEMVINVLNNLMLKKGKPFYIRSDNGPEFIANNLKDWLDSMEINTSYIEPGKPWQNGKSESFNGRFRDECLDIELFNNLRDARVITELWRNHYNNIRPHGSIGNIPPVRFKKQWLKINAGALPPHPQDFLPKTKTDYKIKPNNKLNGSSYLDLPKRSGCVPAEPYPLGRLYYDNLDLEINQ